MSRFTLGQRQALENQLKKTIASLRNEIADALRGKGSGEGIALANHMNEVDDQAIADLETALDIAGVERDLGELREAVGALQRMKTPAYGVCPDCSAVIAFARLQANPAAMRCIDCQSRQEKAAGKAPQSL